MLAKWILLAALTFSSHPDFSGVWKLTTGKATLTIVHRDPELVVETASRGRSASQKYTTDGKESVSTGIDGDEFHSVVVWQHETLLFTIEEHEDGKILKAKEIWSLVDNGIALKRARVTTKAPNGQTLIYAR